MLSLQFTYRVSVEGMSGLAGAFSDASMRPGSVHHDYGAWALLNGIAQMLPGALKQQSQDLLNFLGLCIGTEGRRECLPGIEFAFVSFGWFGVLLYPLLFWGIFWKLALFVLEHRLSPLSSLGSSSASVAGSSS